MTSNPTDLIEEWVRAIVNDGTPSQVGPSADELMEIRNTLTQQESEIEALKAQRLGVLAVVYNAAPQTVAHMCDDDLDRSGALLGEVRKLAAALSTNTGVINKDKARDA